MSLKKACLRDAAASDQSHTLLDTWEPIPSRRLIWAMNYETNKSVAVGLCESSAAYWRVF